MFADCPSDDSRLQTVHHFDFVHTVQLIATSQEILLEKLKWDETSTTFEDRLRQDAKDDGHQRYCALKNDATYGHALDHSKFVPLPTKILDAYHNVECASFMGLIPEIHR